MQGNLQDNRSCSREGQTTKRLRRLGYGRELPEKSNTAGGQRSWRPPTFTRRRSVSREWRNACLFSLSVSRGILGSVRQESTHEEEEDREDVPSGLV
ncbi:uncharacterized protein SPSK_06741 [Sporothrix schenckii 1099-18]|uniref:Uncharacterized protein n=1 Tax=Sporothrix schenckii 1099-18 TaxID=1397361 RepID=A0A0F2MHI6_SPOSC|nr:uncharacterized protein SPSK_06741 [Sporothrix schenckii 1099-18]KJR89158.1 hypothetical protein SPSK_06741 [Sporothrix schenckii 1099-18]